MRRYLLPPTTLVLALSLFLGGCSGESPTQVQVAPTPGPGGSCNVSITLVPPDSPPFAGFGAIVRASVRRAGVPVPDDTAVLFTTNFGFFSENGEATISKRTIGGFADVTVAASNSGRAIVQAAFECATVTLAVEFQPVPSDTQPYISSLSPDQGICTGGTDVAIFGGKFGTDRAAVRVFFGGAPASVTNVNDNVINVKSPIRNLANPQVPETVGVFVQNAGGTSSPPVKYTYYCVDSARRMRISSVSPSFGQPRGGDSVTIFGVNFGADRATTRVTFGGVTASIQSQADDRITVLTPRRTLADPRVSETVDVGVTINLGLVSTQTDVLQQAFTYVGDVSAGACNTKPSLFISSVSPNTGSQTGGTSVVISGGGFGTDPSRTRVEFGGVPAAILTGPTGNSVTVSTPRRTLADPKVPERVAVTITTDLGLPTQACARVENGFTFTPPDPRIISFSPVTGPNDSSTRVTIFGEGFQFPAQVFMLGPAGCRIEATVVDVKADQIVFNTPIAGGGNSCLSSQLATIEVLTGGKVARSNDAFRYYPCPTITDIEPAGGPYVGGTTVFISGNNFEEPVTILVGGVAWDVIDVNSRLITARSRGIDPPGCANVVGDVVVTSSALACPSITANKTFTYQVLEFRPIINGIVPTAVDQDGSDLDGLAGTPATVTISGLNFLAGTSFMRVVVRLPGGTQTLIPISISPDGRSLTFVAPPFSGAFQTQACTAGGGAPGTIQIPTAVPVDVVDLLTGCSASTQLVYTPFGATCVPSAALALTAAPTDATLCSSYAYTLVPSNGVPPYQFSVNGSLPPGLALASGSGAITGTPKLAASGPGVASQTFSFSVTVTDAATRTATANASLKVLDPSAPFSVTPTAPSVSVLGSAGGAVNGAFSSSASPFGPIAWSVQVVPSPSGNAIRASSSGASTNLTVDPGTPPGSYEVTARATDGACTASDPHHSASASLTLVVN